MSRCGEHPPGGFASRPRPSRFLFLDRLYSSRQGERSVHWLKAFVAHAVVLSEWHDVHALGILYLSVMAGLIKRNV